MSTKESITKRFKESKMKKEELPSTPDSKLQPKVEEPLKQEDAQSLPSTPAKTKRVVKPKKQYDLPGQKKDTPDENNALRKFYTSLRSQRKDSELAMKWCVEHGLETREFAEEWLRHTSRKSSASGGSGPGSARRPAQSNGVKTEICISKKKSMMGTTTGQGNSSVGESNPRPVQKRPQKRKIRSAENALPPKEISRAPKTAKFTKPGTSKSIPGGESKPRTQEFEPRTTRPIEPQPQLKQEAPSMTLGITGEAWESSSDDDMPRSKSRIAV